MAENPKAARKYFKAVATTKRTLSKVDSATKKYEEKPNQANKDKVNTANKTDNKAYAKRISLAKDGRRAIMDKRLPPGPGVTVKNTGKGTKVVNGKRIGGKSLRNGK